MLTKEKLVEMINLVIERVPNSERPLSELTDDATIDPLLLDIYHEKGVNLKWILYNLSHYIG